MSRWSGAQTERRIRSISSAWELTDNNWRQAMIPEGGEALVNLNGTAPGIVEKDGKIRGSPPARPGNACHLPGIGTAPAARAHRSEAGDPVRLHLRHPQRQPRAVCMTA
ncbi:MAG: hypothetical protein V8Q30_12930 [Acutalibacteraceae bacterium]